MTREQLRRRVSWAIRVVLLVVLALVLGAPPGLALRVGAYVLAVGVVEALVMSLGPVASRRGRSPFAAVASAQPVAALDPPEALQRLRREASLATQTSGGWHFRLRPTVRDIAGVLLEDRHGIDLDRQPDAARARLGPEVWERLRPDAGPPDDRWAAGIDPEELARLVRQMENLSRTESLTPLSGEGRGGRKGDLSRTESLTPLSGEGRGGRKGDP